MKRNKGITLIALVITIIVALILVGATLAVTLGENGIISQVNKASESTIKAQIKEELNISLVNIKMKSINSSLNEITYYETKEKFITYGEFDVTNKEIKEYIIKNEGEKIELSIEKKKKEYMFRINVKNSTIEEISSIDSSEHSITYMLDGGINGENAVTKYKEGEVVEFPTPTKEGYIFEGWYQKQDFSGNKIIKTTIEMKSNLTLYARWVSATEEAYFTWKTSGTTATITGLSTPGLEVYNSGNLKEVVFPKTYSSGTYTVTTINGGAFSGKTNIEKAVIPFTITTIGQGAFSNCGKTAGEFKVTLEKGRTTLSDGFLKGANYLRSIVIPEGVTTIQGYSYYGLDSDSRGAFYGCVNLENVTMPSSLTTIGVYAFYNCPKITNIAIPSGIQKFGYKCYKGCSGLTEIVIPSNVTQIDGEVFTNCANITKVILPSTNISLGSGVFSGCTKLNSITIPANVKSIGQNTFSNCGKEEGEFQVTLEAGRTTLSDGFLKGANYLRSIVIPEGVTTIQGYSYYGVDSDSRGAFYGCVNLENVTMPNSLTTIGGYAFYNCPKITNIANSSGIQKFGYKCYKGCSGLTEIVIPSNVTQIDGEVFTNCANITKVILPSTNISLGSGVFSGCTKLNSITIPANVTSIGQNTFSNCGKEAGEFQVTLEAGRTTLSDGFLKGANYLRSIVIPEGVTTIQGYSYYGVASDSRGAFYGCVNLENVTMPSSLTTIGVYAFYNCTSLNVINFNNTMEKWSSVNKASNWNYGVPTTSVTCTNGNI